MPPNPLHFSAIAPLHFKRPETFDITALLCSSTFVDIELGFFLLIGKPMTHGFWHSFFFVLTIYPVALSLIIYITEKRFDKTIFGVYRFFRFFPKRVRYSFKMIYFCCLIGGTSHIFFDMWGHENSRYVLFPFYEGNPFWIGEQSIIISVFVTLLSFYAVFLWIKQMQIHRKTYRNKVNKLRETTGIVFIPIPGGKPILQQLEKHEFVREDALWAEQVYS